MHRQAYRPDIDGLRALAIVPVVLYHARFPGVSGGFVGVDVFFVISGFLIAGIIVREIAAGTFSLVRFYERRARRILPALFFVVTVSFAAAGVLLLPGDLMHFGTSAAAALAFASNFYFARDAGYFEPSSEYMPLLHTWTLGIEEQFYVVFPIALLLLTRWFGGGRTPLLAALLAVSLGLGVVGARYAPEVAFYASPARAWELLAGVLLALGAAPPWPRRWQREVAAAAGLVMIVASVVGYDSETAFPGLAALPPCLGAGLIIHGGGMTLTGRALARGPVRFVGLVSYSLYLWHWPILAFLRTARSSVDLPPAVTILGVAGAFVMATLSWHYIERPFRTPGVVGRKTVFALAAAGMVGLGSLGVAARVGDGVPQRFDDRALAVLAEAKVDFAALRACIDRALDGVPCRLGDSKAPVTFLLLGDSHAAAFSSALDFVATASSRGGYLLAGPGCGPLLNVRRESSRRDWRECQTLKDRALALLGAKTEPIDTVILHARWAEYASGERTPGGGGGRDPVVLRRLDPVLDPPAADEDLFREGLESLVVRLRAMGLRVILIGGVPEIGWDVPRTLAAGGPSLWYRQRPPNLAEVRRRNSGADVVLTAVAQAHGLEVIDIAAILCAPECRVIDGDHLLYFDSHHLSSYAGRSVLGPALAGRIWPAPQERVTGDD